MEVLKLKRPALIDGEEKTEIPYDLEKLTGSDLETALQDMKRNGIQVGAIEIDPSYHMAIFAQAAGVATGLGNGTFDGGSIVTREQLSVFLYRYSQYAGDELANGVLDLYNDVDSVQSWALDGMAHAVGAGLITGTDEGNLEPAGPATRAQLAVILQRLMIPAVG